MSGAWKRELGEVTIFRCGTAVGSEHDAQNVRASVVLGRGSTDFTAGYQSAVKNGANARVEQRLTYTILCARRRCATSISYLKPCSFNLTAVLRSGAVHDDKLVETLKKDLELTVNKLNKMMNFSLGFAHHRREDGECVFL